MGFRLTTLAAVYLGAVAGLLYGTQSVDLCIQKYVVWDKNDQQRMLDNTRRAVMDGDRHKANTSVRRAAPEEQDDIWSRCAMDCLAIWNFNYDAVVKSCELAGPISDPNKKADCLENIALTAGRKANAGEYKGTWFAASCIENDPKRQSTLAAVVNIALDDYHLADANEGISKMDASMEKDLLLETLTYKHLGLGENDLATARLRAVGNSNIHSRILRKIAFKYISEGNYLDAEDALSWMRAENEDLLAKKESTIISIIKSEIKNDQLSWAYRFTSILTDSKEKDDCFISIVKCHIDKKDYFRARTEILPVKDLQRRHQYLNEIALLEAQEQDYQGSKFAISFMQGEAKQQTTASVVKHATEHGKLDEGFDLVTTMEPSTEKDDCLLGLAEGFFKDRRYDMGLRAGGAISNLLVRYDFIVNVAKTSAQERDYTMAKFAISHLGKQIREENTIPLIFIAIENEDPNAAYTLASTVDPSTDRDLGLDDVVEGFLAKGDLVGAKKAAIALTNIDLQYKYLADIFWTCIKDNNQKEGFNVLGAFPKGRQYNLIVNGAQWYVDSGYVQGAVDILALVENDEEREGLFSNLSNWYINGGHLDKAASLTEHLSEGDVKNFLHAQLASLYTKREMARKEKDIKYKEDYSKAREMAGHITDEEFQGVVMDSIPKSDLSSKVIEKTKDMLFAKVNHFYSVISHLNMKDKAITGLYKLYDRFFYPYKSENTTSDRMVT